jgi:DNA-binding IclR family transcriptional regulator
MARSAPGAERAVAVLDFLAAHPDETFTLSELARRVDLNKATAHALLTTLADAGYLLRNPTRLTYQLGPALIALGHAAESRFEAVDFAREEMRLLSEELGLECLATAAVGEEMVILARSGMPRGVEASVQPGQRLPLVPPLGSVFMAWAELDEIDRWLQRAPDEDIGRYHLALLAARERGYAVGLEADPQATLGRALAGLADDARSARVRNAVRELMEEIGQHGYILLELDPRASYWVNHLVAPVFGPDGEVVLALSLYGFRGLLTGEQVEGFGQRLLQATGNVTKSIHGKAP